MAECHFKENAILKKIVRNDVKYVMIEVSKILKES